MNRCLERPTSRPSSLLIALALLLATAGFTCPGPDPSAAPGSGGGGTGGTATTTTTSQGGGGATGTGGGCTADITSDPANCGACGRPCAPPGGPFGVANVSCTAGVCDSTCIPGRLNLFLPEAFMGPDDGCESTIHRVFVTDGTFSSNLGGAPGADMKCQMAANAQGLAGIWLAWISDVGSSPSTRFNKDLGPYILLDGTPVANDWIDLTDGQLDHAIDLTETMQPSDAGVWTGTAPDGTAAPSLTYCANWTSPGGTTSFGFSSSSDGFWTANPNDPGCDNILHLYCFEQFVQ